MCFTADPTQSDVPFELVALIGGSAICCWLFVVMRSLAALKRRLGQIFMYDSVPIAQQESGIMPAQPLPYRERAPHEARPPPRQQPTRGAPPRSHPREARYHPHEYEQQPPQQHGYPPPPPAQWSDVGAHHQQPDASGRMHF